MSDRVTVTTIRAYAGIPAGTVLSVPAAMVAKYAAIGIVDAPKKKVNKKVEKQPEVEATQDATPAEPEE